MHSVLRGMNVTLVAAALNILLLGVGFAQGPKLDVPYVPTEMPVVNAMLRMANVSKDDFLIDLGSGDGRIPIAAAKLHGTRGLGVDLDPRRVAEARRAAQVRQVADKVDFRQEDVFDTDISKATVITMYLLPDVNFRLRPRLLLEPRPGTRIVSHEFDLGDWKPDRTLKIKSSTLYLWIVPAQVEGRWQLADPGLDEKEPVTINIMQRFQHIAGIAKVRGRSVPLRRAELEADRIKFELPVGEGQTRRYEGRILDDRLVGEIWSASRIEQ